MKFKPPKSKEVLKEIKSPIKRNISRWQWYLIVCFIMSPLAFMVWTFVSDHYFIKAKGSLMTNNYIIKAPEDGYIEETYVRLGSPVKSGDEIIEIESPTTEAHYQTILKQIDNIKETQSEIHNSELEHLEAMYQASKEYVADSQKFYDGIKEYRQQKLVNIFDLQQSREILHRAQMELKDVSVQIAQSKEDYLSDSDSNFAKEIRALEIDKAMLEARLEKLKITSEDSAVVNHIYVYDGEFVQKGQNLASLSLFDEPYIKAYLDSKYINYAHQGDRVIIRFSSGETFKGKVENSPIFAEANKAGSVFSTEESKVVIIVVPEQELPEKYIINGAPVYIDFSRI